MKIYLAGPMTGYPSYNFQLFEEVAGFLRQQGYNIASPHEIDHGESEMDRGKQPYEVYVRAGLKMLLECDTIIMMTGWETSKGCLTELYVATACGMRILFFNTKTGILSLNSGRDG